MGEVNWKKETKRVEGSKFSPLFSNRRVQRKKTGKKGKESGKN
jgi:hypothetical protein